jgi:hypothetical protein
VELVEFGDGADHVAGFCFFSGPRWHRRLLSSS